MTTVADVHQRAAEQRSEWFRDGLVRPFLALVAIAGTLVQLPSRQVLYPSVTLPLFVFASLATIASLLPWNRLSQRQQVTLAACGMISSAVLLPLVHNFTLTSVLAYLAASTAGVKLESRRIAIAVAVVGALVAVAATVLVEQLAPASSVDQWSWWFSLTIALPVYIGTSVRDRNDALYNAQQAAEQAKRAADSEAREAALQERGRIAREIHDVLGHSLSGIALQLDMADALRERGHDDESTAAVRRARALAVDSINETRRAVHALREDTLPLTDTISQLAEHSDAEFIRTGEPRTLGADATHTLIRAAQEALTNATKYAPGATRAITLAFAAHTTTLTVTNGPAATGRSDLAGGTGMGLVGMRERVALLGGTVAAGPTPAGGWTVELEIPQ
jgi:signal transduction histidine kinase